MKTVSVPFGDRIVMVEYVLDWFDDLYDYNFYSPVTDKVYGPFVHKMLMKNKRFRTAMYDAIIQDNE